MINSQAMQVSGSKKKHPEYPIGVKPRYLQGGSWRNNLSKNAAQWNHKPKAHSTGAANDQR